MLLLIPLPLLLAVSGQPAAPDPPLVTAAAVRELTGEQANRPHAVDLTGVVTLVAPNRLELFLQDGTCGVYVQTTRPFDEGVRRGARVQVDGQSKSGWFSSIVSGRAVRVLGADPLPTPLPFDLSANGSRWLDGQYVQCHCLVREAAVVNGRGRLIVEGAGGVGRLEFLSPIGTGELRKWVGAVVRASGVCIPEFDEQRKATGAAVIRLSDAGDVEVVQTADRVSALPVRAAAHLRRYLPSTSPIPLVRASGVVVAQLPPDALVVQDDTGGYTVRLRSGAPDAFPPGTRVHISGFLIWNSGRIAVGSGEVTAAGVAALPDPREVRVDDPAADGCRVRLRGHVTEVRADHLVLVTEDATVTVQGTGAPGAVAVGSFVTATGALVERPAGPLLLLNSPADLTVESVPESRWLSGTQVGIAAATVGLLALLGGGWLVALRAAVRTRTREFAESEQKFATAFHSSPDAMTLTRAADGVFLEVNGGFCRLTGFARDQALGRSSLELSWLDPGDRTRMLDTLRQNGGVRDYPATVRDARGRVREVAISSTPVTVGGEDCLLGIIRDVTEQKEAERAAREEKRFTDTMMESMPGVLYFYNAARTFLRWNRNFEAVTGYSAAEVARMHPLDFFRGEDKALLAQRIEAVFETGAAFVEAPFVSRSGAATPYLFTGRRVVFGGAPCLVGIGIDVSERHEAERRLAESARRYRELVELANSIILRWTPEGRVAFLNEFGQRFFGYTAEEIVGRHVMDTIVPGTETTGRDLGELMARVCADPKAFEQNLNENVRRTGERAWIAWTNRIVFDADGQVVEILSVGTDVTEKRRMEQAVAASEKKFATMFRLSPHPIALSDIESHRFTEVNDAFVAALGWERGELLSRTSAELDIWVDRDQRAGIWADLLAGRPVRGREVRFRRKDGEVRDCLFSLDLAEVDGRRCALGAWQDITDRRRMEQALAASERKFAAVFRLTPVALSLSRLADGVILEVNQAFERVYRLRREQVIGHRASNFPQLYDDPAERAGYLKRILRDGRLRDIEKRRALDDGTRVDTVTAADVIELDGARHLLVVTTDVTALKRAEAALRNANATLERRVAERTDELAATNQELEAFCYSVSHDLRAPLRAIDGFTQAVLEDCGTALDADGALYLARVRAAAHRMSELIDDLLTLSRVTRAGMNRQPVDLSALAAEALADLRQADPGREVEVALAPGLTAYGDRALLRVVLDNLLSNAWKYTGRTARPQIEFFAEDSPRGRVFVVRDNGAGFDPAYAHKLFQPFQRLHRSDEFPGHGIGLATVQRVVRRHGGAVTAEGSVYGGATFRFTIPYLDEDQR